MVRKMEIGINFEWTKIDTEKKSWAASMTGKTPSNSS
jgi:hypothetical protein